MTPARRSASAWPDPPRLVVESPPARRRPGLADWLGDVTLDEFPERYLHVEPLAGPSTTLTSRALLDWPALDRLLGLGRRACGGARVLRMPAPHSVAELRGYFDAGIGLALRRTERQLPGLAELATSFGVIGTPHVQAFATPGGRHGSAAMFTRFADEHSPLCTATRVAGDFLYVPARWWHMAVCREDAVSISVGVMAHGG